MVVALHDEIVEALNYLLHVVFNNCHRSFPLLIELAKLFDSFSLTCRVTGSHCCDLRWVLSFIK